MLVRVNSKVAGWKPKTGSCKMLNRSKRLRECSADSSLRATLSTCRLFKWLKILIIAIFNFKNVFTPKKR